MSDLWPVFLGHLLISAGALWLGRRIGAMTSRRWIAAALMATALLLMLACILVRVFPVGPIELLGPAMVSCLEFTGLMMPAALLFGIASRRMPREKDRRAILLLALIAGVYFVKAGWWMIGPGVRTPSPPAVDQDGVCRQTTTATCVAASMVTALLTRGIEATEEEMARLAYTEPSGGTTDSRALWALERKLAGTAFTARYARMDLSQIRGATKPVLVQLRWGFFVSHMVPVLVVSDAGVVIGDPMGGMHEMPLAEFEREWKGMGIVIEERAK